MLWLAFCCCVCLSAGAPKKAPKQIPGQSTLDTWLKPDRGDMQFSESEHGMEVFDAVARARRWDEQERRERAPPEEQWEFDQWHAKQPDS